MTARPLAFLPPASPPAAVPTLDPPANRLTAGGAILGLAAAAIALSAVRELRIEAGGLLIHPYLVPTALVFLAVVRRYAQVPVRILAPILAFVGLYLLSTVPEYGGGTEVVKFSAAFVTTLTAAFAVRTERDVVAVTLGLTLAATFMSVQGLLGFREAGVGGINPLEGIANKNSFSLYALPAVLLALHASLSAETPRSVRIVLLVGALTTVIAIFSTGNRSGYLGVLAIVAMMALRAGKRLRTLLLIAAFGAAAMYLLTTFGDTSVIQERIDLTQRGYASDETRQELVIAAFQIALENPAFGVSPQRLPLELARLVPTDADAIDPHNTIAHVVGGGGFITLGALVVMLWSLWRKPPEWTGRPVSVVTTDAHFLLRAMIVLWVVRALFTREILYHPSFSMALGACIGLAAIRGVWRRHDHL